MSSASGKYFENRFIRCWRLWTRNITGMEAPTSAQSSDQPGTPVRTHPATPPSAAKPTPTRVQILGPRRPRTRTPQAGFPSLHRDSARGVEQLGAEANAGLLQTLAELRSYSRRPVEAAHAPVLVDTLLLEHEDVLGGDHLFLHAGDLRHSHDLSRSVAQPREVDDHVERGRDILANRAHGRGDAGEQHHRLEPREGVAGRVRVYRGERAVVSGVHRLEHVEHFGASHLAH